MLSPKHRRHRLRRELVPAIVVPFRILEAFLLTRKWLLLPRALVCAFRGSSTKPKEVSTTLTTTSLLTIIDVQKLFEEIQWHQRFRLQDSTNFRIDRTEIPVGRSRYGNVLPYAKNRVKLKTPFDGSDFINASHVSLESRPQAVSPPGSARKFANRLSSTERALVSQSKYIATQGPRSTEYSHFWHMVMHESVGDAAVVVMLTKFQEGGRDKCGVYLPTDLEDPIMKIQSSAKSRSGTGAGEF